MEMIYAAQNVMVIQIYEEECCCLSMTTALVEMMKLHGQWKWMRKKKMGNWKLNIIL